MEKIRKITIRLKEKDYLKLCVQTSQFNKSQNELIRELIRKNFIDDIKEHNQFLREIFFLYKNISNNLNQLVKRVNSKDINTDKIKVEIDEIWHLLNQ